MTDLERDIEKRIKTVKNHGNADVKTVSDRVMADIAATHGLTVGRVGMTCLSMGIMPLRYLRNMTSIGIKDQEVLGNSCVAVAGAGGLGGHVIVHLARLGIGKLKVFDPDIVDETNLNRQTLARIDNQGSFKAEEAARQCALINPLVEVEAHARAIDSTCGIGLFDGTHVLVDALDSIRDRLFLASLAHRLTIPLVHGAVAGFEGRVMTVMAGERHMESLYDESSSGKAEPSAEALLGTPSLAPAVTAAFQAMAVLNILLNRKSTRSGKFHHIDLQAVSIQSFQL